MMIEYADEAERRTALMRLVGIERCVWVAAGDGVPVRAIADEDLERTTAEKTSAVHFLRFELGTEMIAALRGGADVAMGISHPACEHRLDAVPETVRESLLADLD